MKSKEEIQQKLAKKQILIVEPYPLIISGIAAALSGHSDLIICGTASDLHSALDAIEMLNPDLVISAISLKGSNGIELLKNIKVRWPKRLVLMLSMHDETLYAVRALRAGAMGYLMKHNATEEELLRAIRRVLRREPYLSEKMQLKTTLQFIGPARSGSPLEDLSDRELEVFNLIGEGKGTQQIAEELCLSYSTLATHRRHIREKLGLKSLSELVQYAIQWREV